MGITITTSQPASLAKGLAFLEELNMRNILNDLLEATEDVKPRGRASMKKSEAKQHANDIVWQMLGGRCCPEVSDVCDITDDPDEQEQVIDEINAILTRLAKRLKPKHCFVTDPILKEIIETT